MENVTQDQHLLNKYFVSPDGEVEFNEYKSNLNSKDYKYQNFYKICKSL